MQKLSYEEQSIITRGIIKAAVLMSEYGAESILIEQTAQRLGKVLGISSVEISLIPSAIVLTTLKSGQSVTTTRRVHHKPINMSIVCQIQKIVLDMERRDSEVNYDISYLYTILKQIEPNYYNMVSCFYSWIKLCIFCIFARWRLSLYGSYFCSFIFSYVYKTRAC